MADDLKLDGSFGGGRSASGAAQVGYLPKEYQIQFNQSLPEFSTQFAAAYDVIPKGTPSDVKVYALLYDKRFPIPYAAIEVLSSGDSNNLVRVFDHGKVLNASTGEEVYGVILEKPIGEKLSSLFPRVMPFEEKVVMRKMLDQLSSAVQGFYRAGIMHGRICPDNVYFDKASSRLIIGECISDFPGYSQDTAYESLNPLLCSPAAKGNKDVTADSFSIGMILLLLISGQNPFDDMSSEEIIDWRLHNGSCDAVLKKVFVGTDVAIGRRSESVFKGLLTDEEATRWLYPDIRKFLRMEDVPAPTSKMHKEAANSFVFDNVEYFSSKLLANDIYKKWQIAKRTLRVSDLSRWTNLSVKRTETADMIDMLFPNASQDVVISDDKLARLIVILDPAGPMRYLSFSGSVHGLGNALSDIYIQSDREKLQHFGFIFNDGLLQYWINRQPDPDDYGYGMLGWSPVKVRQNIRRSAMGFGMERCLYDLNLSLACQSKIIKSSYVGSVADLLVALDAYDGDRENEDPTDRHISAYLASKIGLIEEMSVQNLKNYPSLARNPQVLLLALLSVAQKGSNAPMLPRLCDWMMMRLAALEENLHSQNIRREMQSKMKKAAKTGKLQNVYAIVTSPNFVVKDLHGFKKARMEYDSMNKAIRKLKTRESLFDLAYRNGLRVSVTTAYGVLAVTIMYALFSV